MNRQQALVKYIQSKTPSLKKILPKHIGPVRFSQLILNEFQRNPRLFECSRESIFGALLLCAQTGLYPGPEQHAHLIPYGKQCQFQIGYRGLLQLTRNSGEVSWVKAVEVKEKDEFYFQHGLNERLDHIPLMDGPRGDLKWVYTIAKMKDGEVVWIVLSRADVEAVRSVAKAGTGKGTAWGDWTAEMWKKTAIKRICKILPLSSEDKRKIAQDEKTVFATEVTDPVLDMPDMTDWNSLPEIKKHETKNVKDEVGNGKAIVHVESDEEVEEDKPYPDEKMEGGFKLNPENGKD